MVDHYNTLHLLLCSAGLALFGLACMQDWAIRLVPNRIPIAIAAIGLVLRAAEGTLLTGLLAAATVFSLAVLCWRQGWIGGADVKLFTAGTILVTPGSAAGFILVSCLAGGVLAVAYAAVSCLVPAPSPNRPTGRLRRYLRLEQRRLRRRGPLPYATAIAAGAAFILAQG